MKLLLFALLMTAPMSLLGADWVDLWPGEAPGAKRPPAGTESGKGGWRFSNTEVPQFYLFRAEKPSGSGVVVLPGGGYSGLAADHEGKQVGEFFAKRGVTAMVVKYRVSGNAALGYQFPVPQLDARRAIRTMRFKCKEWGIDSNQIGIMGFSAGGHLCSTAVTMFEDKFEEETNDEIDKLSCRPDFGILCYPVISMGEKYCHAGSVRNLLGGSPSKELLARNNTSKRVTKKTPPIFWCTQRTMEPCLFEMERTAQPPVRNTRFQWCAIFIRKGDMAMDWPGEGIPPAGRRVWKSG